MVWLHGTQHDDQLSGTTGDDLVTGRGGNDWLNGDTGYDRLYGGIGNDTLVDTDGGALHGGRGDDTLMSFDTAGNFTAHETHIYGETGNDWIWTQDGYADGGKGDDSLFTMIRGPLDGLGTNDNYAQLKGGSGADIFHVYGSHDDGGAVGFAAVTEIADFNPWQGDRLDVATVVDGAWQTRLQTFAGLDTNQDHQLDGYDIATNFGAVYQGPDFHGVPSTYLQVEGDWTVVHGVGAIQDWMMGG